MFQTFDDRTEKIFQIFVGLGGRVRGRARVRVRVGARV